MELQPTKFLGNQMESQNSSLRTHSERSPRFAGSRVFFNRENKRQWPSLLSLIQIWHTVCQPSDQTIMSQYAWLCKCEKLLSKG